jgi:hypothetical protein
MPAANGGSDSGGDSESFLHRTIRASRQQLCSLMKDAKENSGSLMESYEVSGSNGYNRITIPFVQPDRLYSSIRSP